MSADSNFETETAAGHARDEADGFVAQMLEQFAARGYSDVKPLGAGRDARIFSATSPRNGAVALRAAAPFAMERWRNKPTLRNYLRVKLLPLFAPRHPNLVRYYGAFRQRFLRANATIPIACLEMQRVNGIALLELLGTTEFKRDGVMRIEKTMRGILEGWNALHRAGLRQGDLSPGNILLETGSLNPVLIDLRFSLRFLREPEREFHELRCTLRAMLTGVWRREAELPALKLEEACAFWGSQEDALRKWVAFSEDLARGGKLFGRTPGDLSRCV